MAYEREIWEYKIVTVQSDAEARHEGELNTLGRDGWQLVGTLQLGPASVRYVLMRPER